MWLAGLQLICQGFRNKADIGKRDVIRLVHCICSALRRVCAPAKTGSNRQYPHFRRNSSAPVDLLLRWVRRYFPALLGRNSPGAGFQSVEYLPSSSAFRNRAQATQAAQQTQLVDELTRHRRSIVENMFAWKVKKCVLCRPNQAPPTSQNGEVAVTSVSSTQHRRLSGHVHGFWDYAQAATLAVDKHSASMSR